MEDQQRKFVLNDSKKVSKSTSIYTLDRMAYAQGSSDRKDGE